MASAAAVCVLSLRLDFGVPAEIAMRDDAFYVFAWARSLAAGDGPCVTPGVPTNGVQPLWGVLLAAAALVFGPGSLPLVAQVVGLMLHAATAGLVAVVLRSWPAIAVAAAALYAGEPFLLHEAQNGQETALACALAAALFVASRGRERTFAVVAVLAPLARTELLLMVPVVALWRHGWRLRASSVPMAAAGVWILVQLVVAGHVMPDSALPMAWLHDQLQPTPKGVAAWLAEVWWWGRPCLLGSPFHLVDPILVGAWLALVLDAALRGRVRFLPLLFVVGAVAAGLETLAVPSIAALVLAVTRRAAPALRAPWLPWLLGWILIAALHHLWRHYPRPYYFAPAGSVAVLALGSLAARRPRSGTALILAAATLQLVRAATPAERQPWQAEYALAARELHRFVPDGEPVGCFNSGIVTWLRDGPVVNLDGVVDRPAFEALQQRRLARFLDERGVRYLLDAPVQFASPRDGSWPHACGDFFGEGWRADEALLEVARFDVPGVDAERPGTDSFRLYRLRDSAGAVPPRPPTRDLGGSGVDHRQVLWAARPGRELWLQSPDGSMRRLARADVATSWLLFVSTRLPGPYLLREDPHTDPILILDPPRTP